MRLTGALVEEMMTKMEKITFWSDSTTVLHWIRQTSSTYKAFVGNRVSEIHTIMSNLEATLGVGTVSWRYVSTDSNPADDITRGPSLIELGTGFRYNDGPKFLYDIAQNAYCSWDIYLLHGKNYRSVMLAVKRELNDCHWSKFTRALLRREYRLAHQLVGAELKDKGLMNLCSFYCFLISHLCTVAE